MELELGLAPPSTDLMVELRLGSEKRSKLCRKRGFEQMFDKVTLPLFMQKKDDDDDNGNIDSTLEHSQELDYNGDRDLVGWPPVKLSRRKSEDCGGRRANCVKVKMEGVTIGRKVDLSLHDSYQSLFHTLNQMFPRKQHDREKVVYHGQYMVTFEDEDGDWMVVGAVPWETFIKSVKRLNILN